MKADIEDAPEWIKRRSHKRGGLGGLVAGVIGTVITFCALNFAGQAYLQATVKSLAERTRQPSQKPVATVSRADAEPEKDWDRIVADQLKRDALSRQSTGAEQPTIKQNVFNDHNYTPRGADNVVSLRDRYPPEAPKKAPEKVRVTVVEQTPSMKDRACGATKEGSLERRNCRTHVGLNYRD